MENTADLSSPSNDGCGRIQLEIEFEDNDDTIKNAGTLEMRNSGDLFGACRVEIGVQFDENEGPLTNAGTIIMTNSGDATSQCDDTSRIEIEIENEAATFINTGTLTMKNTGDADDIEVEIENIAEGSSAIVSNSGEMTITNEGDARDQHDIGIFNERLSLVENLCGGSIEITTTDGFANDPKVGIGNFGIFNNYGDATIKIDDDGTITENEDIVVVEGDPITFFDLCKAGPPQSAGDVYVVMGRFGNEDPENGSLATANLATGLLSQVGARISSQVIEEGGGLSGLAIDSTGRFFVTAVASPAILLEVDGGTGEILNNLGEISDDGDNDVKVKDLAFQPGTDILFGIGDVSEGGSDNSLFTLDTEDGTFELVSVIEDNQLKGIAFDPTDGALYAVNNDGDGGCDLTTLDPTGVSNSQTFVTDLDRCYDGLGIDRDGQMFATSRGDSLHLIDPSVGSDITVAGSRTNPSDVDFLYSPQTTGGGAPYDDPTLGIIVRSGYFAISDGFCFDQYCLDVLEYFNHLPIQEVDAGSSHTITLSAFVPHGSFRADYASVGGTPPGMDINSVEWNVILQRVGITDEWDLIVIDDNAVLGVVTGSVQIVDNLRIVYSFNIEFLTPASIGTVDGNAVPPEDNMFIVTEIRDSYGGSARNIFNEGMFVNDIYAYPQTQALYQSPVEVEPLCLNEDPTMRYTCAFDLVREWTIKQAEEKLQEMYNENGNEMDSFDESERY